MILSLLRLFPFILPSPLLHIFLILLFFSYGFCSFSLFFSPLLFFPYIFIDLIFFLSIYFISIVPLISYFFLSSIPISTLSSSKKKTFVFVSFFFFPYPFFYIFFFYYLCFSSLLPLPIRFVPHSFFSLSVLRQERIFFPFLYYLPSVLLYFPSFFFSHFATPFILNYHLLFPSFRPKQD